MWMYNYLKDEAIKWDRSLSKQIVSHLRKAIKLSEEKLSPTESPIEEGQANSLGESGEDVV